MWRLKNCVGGGGRGCITIDILLHTKAVTKPDFKTTKYKPNSNRGLVWKFDKYDQGQCHYNCEKFIYYIQKSINLINTSTIYMYHN